MLKPIVIAVGIGAVLELIFAWMFFGSGWGPCGPGSALGFIGLIAHIFPGLLVGLFVQSLGAPDQITNIVVVAAQFGFWSWLVLISERIFSKVIRIDA